MRLSRFLLLLLLPALLWLACSSRTHAPADTQGPDRKALAIADAVMRAQGGQASWAATRFISWNFFGSRSLVWDKHRGICRIEWKKRPWKVIVNLHDGSGRVQLKGEEQTHPDTLRKYLDLGKRAWINDSYWLIMPFKLRDPGVTLRYLGRKNTEAGQAADVLQLTFSNVGVTPENKYHVWVDTKTHLVTQWAFFKKYTDEKPDFINAWSDYQRKGKILLSGNRGKSGSLTDIQVSDSVPEGTFERF